MSYLTQDIKKEAIIYSFVLFVVGVLIGFYIGSSLLGLEDSKVGVMYAVWIIILALTHEITHYLGYLVFGGLKPSEIEIVSRSRNELPNLVPKVEISSKSRILVGSLPAIVVPLVAIFILYNSGNMAYFPFVGIGMGMSGADIVLMRKPIVNS